MTYAYDFNQSKNKKNEQLEANEKEFVNHQSIIEGIRENKASINNIFDQLEILAQRSEQSNSKILKHDEMLNEELGLIKKNLNLIEERNITIYRDIKEIIDLNNKRIIYILHRQDKIYNLAPLRLIRKIKNYIKKLKNYIKKIKKYISKEKISKSNQGEESQYDKIIVNNFTINHSPKKIMNELKSNKSIDK